MKYKKNDKIVLILSFFLLFPYQFVHIKTRNNFFKIFNFSRSKLN